MRVDGSAEARYVEVGEIVLPSTSNREEQPLCLAASNDRSETRRREGEVDEKGESDAEHPRRTDRHRAPQKPSNSHLPKTSFFFFDAFSVPGLTSLQKFHRARSMHIAVWSRIELLEAQPSSTPQGSCSRLYYTFALTHQFLYRKTATAARRS